MLYNGLFYRLESHRIYNYYVGLFFYYSPEFLVNILLSAA